MSFWDSSALVPLCLNQPASPAVGEIYRSEGTPVVWWAALVECRSAFERLRRDGDLTLPEKQQAAALLAEMAASWREVLPGTAVRDRAVRVLAVHPLRAAEALQLASALVWAGEEPSGRKFVCLDQRLRECAQLEGFTVLPASVA